MPSRIRSCFVVVLCSTIKCGVSYSKRFQAQSAEPALNRVFTDFVNGFNPDTSRWRSGYRDR